MPKPLCLVTLCILSALAPNAAFALDCSKARTAEEKAICADPQAEAADEAMAKAYKSLAASLSGGDQKALLQSQRQWLKSRANICGAADPSALGDCLRKETVRRELYLEGRPETGPGSGHDLVPVLVEQSGDKTKYDLDIAVLKYKSPALPGEKLFNAKIDALLKDAPSAKDSDAQPDLTYSYDLSLRLLYASPKFLSAQLQSYLFSGGAHGNTNVTNLNIDMEKGVILRFSDVFEPKAAASLHADCLRQIEAQKAVKLPDQKLDADEKRKLGQTIAATLPDLDRWSFSADQAEVTFNAYELGAYVEGPYVCDFPGAFLRPLRKLDYVLP